MVYAADTVPQGAGKLLEDKKEAATNGVLSENVPEIATARTTTHVRRAQAFVTADPLQVNSSKGKSLNAILKKSGKAAFAGGLPGFVAGVVQVLSLVSFYR